MAQSSWPSPADSRVVSDLQYEQLVAAQYADGQLGSPSDSPLVYADGSGRQVFVRAGRFAQLRGHGWTSGSPAVTLAIGANSSGSTRIDLVVLGLDRSTWNVTVYAKAGTPGSGAPALQTDTGTTGIYEMPLAEVTVPNGASVTSAGQVKPRAWWTRADGYASSGTDTRPPSPVTGEVLWESGTKYVWNGSIWERISNPPAPTQTFQVTTYSGTTGSTGIGGDSDWHRFTTAAWPVLTFAVPASGRFYVTIGGFVEHRLTASSIIVMSYGMSGGGSDSTISSAVLGPRSISARNGRVCASRRRLYTGMTPGATVTVTPYYLSTTASASEDITSLRDGNLLMEPA